RREALPPGQRDRCQGEGQLMIALWEAGTSPELGFGLIGSEGSTALAYLRELVRVTIAVEAERDRQAGCLREDEPHGLIHISLTIQSCGLGHPREPAKRIRSAWHRN